MPWTKWWWEVVCNMPLSGSDMAVTLSKCDLFGSVCKVCESVGGNYIEGSCYTFPDCTVHMRVTSAETSYSV